MNENSIVSIRHSRTEEGVCVWITPAPGYSVSVMIGDKTTAFVFNGDETTAFDLAPPEKGQSIQVVRATLDGTVRVVYCHE